MNVDVHFGKMIKAKETTLKEFYIYTMIRNHRQLNLFSSGLITITKDVKKDLIKKIRVSNTFLNDRHKVEALENYKMVTEVLANNNRYLSTVITTDKYLFSNNISIERNIYNIAPIDENRIINQYLENQDKIVTGKARLQAQELSIGNGLIISDTSEKTRLKIDFQEIKSHTIAIMFGIDYVIKNDIYKLISAIKDV